MAIFGGTFDPIHYGHLRSVERLAQIAGLKRIILLPNNIPPHRQQPEATSAQRVAMIKLAIASNSLFDLDLRELHRDTPSYTIDTITELRNEYYNEQPIALIIGQDVLLNFHTWHRWQELLSICHLLVCKRPTNNFSMNIPNFKKWINQHLVKHPQFLEKCPAGKIFIANNPLISISATDIRASLHNGSLDNNLLPLTVTSYIYKKGLYLKK